MSYDTDPADDSPRMDEDDIKWVETFMQENQAHSIPQGSIVDGFVGIVAYVDPNGDNQWFSYNTLDKPLSSIIGLLEMAKYKMMADNYITLDEGEDDG